MWSREYSSMDAWPALKMNLSLFSHFGSFGLCFKYFDHSVYAIGALPSGRPGWPLFAFWIASAESTRMVLTASLSTLLILVETSCEIFTVMMGLEKHFYYNGFPHPFQPEKATDSFFECYKLTSFVLICSKQPRMFMRGCFNHFILISPYFSSNAAMCFLMSWMISILAERPS